MSKTSKKAPDRYSCYRLIKRGINIAEITGDYNIFYEVAYEASELYSGNEDILAYYVMSLLKIGDYKKAHEIANDQLISNEFKPLLAQTILFNDNKNPQTNSIIDYINSRKDPSFFEYLATLLNNRSLYVNSALLWAKDGEIEKAYKVIENQGRDGIEELNALLTYDSGRQSEALIKLLELPLSEAIKFNNILLIADIFYYKENYSRSRFYYEKAIELEVINSAPYMNISSIYIKENNIKKAISFLKKIVTKLDYKINEELNLLDDLKSELKTLTELEEINLLKRRILQSETDIKNIRSQYKELVLLSYHLFKEIKSDNSIKILEDYRRLFPKDVTVELLYMKENKSKINSDLFIARLWQLLNTDIENREVSEFLVWYLLGVENFEDIELVLERSENRHRGYHWTEYYRGLLNGLQGNYKIALEKFNSFELDVESWEILYNKGIIEMALLNYPESLVLFNKSIIAINQKNFVNNRDKYLSQIKTKIAQVLINLNDTDEAIRILNSAFELDPDNYTSDLLKSIYIDLMESD